VGEVAGVERLLPHGPEARMLREIASSDGERLVARARIPAGGALGIEGAPAYLALEIAAQAAAAHGALGGPAGGGARSGVLVGAKAVAFHRATLPVERDLVVRVRRTAAAPPLLVYEAELDADGALAFRGTLSAWVEGPA
jgi:predicted hotdog family 3-hydroxylacyl-ACP dehydratase